MFHYMNDRKNYYSDEEIETSYDRVEKIISLMNLGEKHLIVLNGRLRGDTYAQLAAILPLYNRRRSRVQARNEKTLFQGYAKSCARAVRYDGI